MSFLIFVCLVYFIISAVRVGITKDRALEKRQMEKAKEKRLCHVVNQDNKELWIFPRRIEVTTDYLKLPDTLKLQNH